MNIQDVMKMSAAWTTFTQNHPKFPAFLQAVRNVGIKEGSIIAVSITDPDGRVIDTNVKISASDLELFESLKNMQ
ncbi:MAG: hypothetical protein K5931_07535 [Lachnospiraceae bacterium]|nr:hypothetical protein [Lachnospiraceae bacterium]